ncbi:MAG: spinster family MFS transporter [Gammaproteobacteria bacterium]
MNAPQSHVAADAAMAPYARRGYRGYVLALFTSAYVFSFIDRQVLVMLQESVKREIHLTDTQLGLLSGFSFVIFYTGFGVLIARWADRGTRRSIVALCVGLWSLMTAATGFAQNLWHLVVARVGVGVGEGGCNPPVHSMLSDIYPPRRRAGAIAIFMLGSPLGALIGYAGAGWLNELFGWRATFIILGVAGLILAPLIRYTVVEPVRGASEPAGSAAPAPAPGVAEVFRTLAGNTVFRHIALGGAFAALAITASMAWLPSYLIRRFEIGTGELGTWLALTAGAGASIGTFLGGVLGDRFARRQERHRLLAPFVGALVSAPFLVATLLAPAAIPAILFNAVPATLLAFWIGPVHAIHQGLVPNRMRAMTSAVIHLVMNLLGVGLAPLAVGLISDALSPAHGIDGLRMAMGIVGIAGIAGAALHFALAMRAMPATPAR